MDPEAMKGNKELLHKQRCRCQTAVHMFTSSGEMPQPDVSSARGEQYQITLRSDVTIRRTQKTAGMVVLKQALPARVSSAHGCSTSGRAALSAAAPCRQHALPPSPFLGNSQAALQCSRPAAPGHVARVRGMQCMAAAPLQALEQVYSKTANKALKVNLDPKNYGETDPSSKCAYCSLHQATLRCGGGSLKPPAWLDSQPAAGALTGVIP